MRRPSPSLSPTWAVPRSLLTGWCVRGVAAAALPGPSLLGPVLPGSVLSGSVLPDTALPDTGRAPGRSLETQSVTRLEGGRPLELPWVPARPEVEGVDPAVAQDVVEDVVLNDLAQPESQIRVIGVVQDSRVRPCRKVDRAARSSPSGPS